MDAWSAWRYSAIDSLGGGGGGGGGGGAASVCPMLLALIHARVLQSDQCYNFISRWDCRICINNIHCIFTGKWGYHSAAYDEVLRNEVKHYSSSCRLFDHSYHGDEVEPQLANLRKQVKLQKVGNSEGIPVKCGSTYCVFEFMTYRYYRGTSWRKGIHRAPDRGTPVRSEPHLQMRTTIT